MDDYSGTDAPRLYERATEVVRDQRGKFIGRAYRFSEDNRPRAGDPVAVWGGGFRYVQWARAHRRRWSVRTDDGVLRKVVEFPTSFLWSQVG